MAIVPESLRICGYGWLDGGQAEYVMVPYADFNPIEIPPREQAMEKRY
jgi:threonine dehydrogenase-like Zn-dependent dehydrogenase